MLSPLSVIFHWESQPFSLELVFKPAGFKYRRLGARLLCTHDPSFTAELYLDHEDSF